MIRAVIVDVDDTLCLTEAACFRLENDVLAMIGRPPMSRSVHIFTWGMPLMDAVAQRSPGIDLQQFADVYPSVMKRYVAEGLLDVVPPRNVAALDRLRAQGHEVMLLTARSADEVAHMLVPGHALAARLVAVYHSGRTRFHKPDPRVFDELLVENGLSARDCVYIGDSPSDAIAAKGAGIRFVASLESGLRSTADFDVTAVDAFINTFPQLVDAVDRLDGDISS